MIPDVSGYVLEIHAHAAHIIFLYYNEGQKEYNLYDLNVLNNSTEVIASSFPMHPNISNNKLWYWYYDKSNDRYSIKIYGLS